MRKIEAPAIIVFLALLSLVLALAIGTAWYGLESLPLGDFRGIAISAYAID